MILLSKVPILSANNLSKIYTLKTGSFLRKRTVKEVHALSNISFEINDGELICLLGPNGAGKTTLIKIMTLLLMQTSGSFTVNGIPGDMKYEHQIKASIGAMLMGERGLYWKLTGRENLNYFHALYHQPKQKMKKSVQNLLDMMNVSDIADRPVESYSSGQKMKFAFLRSLVADPPILILDEPTVAMDVQGARELRKIVKELNEDKHKTIVYSTHIMTEVEELADRVVIIDKGKLVDFDTITNLTSSLDQDESINIEGIFNSPNEIIYSLKSISGVKYAGFHKADNVEHNDILKVIVNDTKQQMPAIIGELLRNNVQINYIDPKRISIEDVFIARTGYGLSEDTTIV